MCYQGFSPFPTAVTQFPPTFSKNIFLVTVLVSLPLGTSSLHEFKLSTRLADRSHHFSVEFVWCNYKFHTNAFFFLNFLLWYSYRVHVFQSNLIEIKCQSLFSLSLYTALSLSAHSNNDFSHIRSHLISHCLAWSEMLKKRFNVTTYS